MSDAEAITEDNPEELDEAVPEEELDDEDDGLADTFDTEDATDEVSEDEDEDDDDVATPARPEDEDDDEDEDDVEADLDAILKDRIAAGDDDDDDEDGPPQKPPPIPGSAEAVQARQENEFSCPHCFLLVNGAAVNDGECPHCGGPISDGS